MLANNNNEMSYNNFSDMPKIPYKIIEAMLTDNSEEVEKFWKLLKYPTKDCLSKDNLTFEEKKSLVWDGDTSEQNFNIFVKPLIGSSTESAVSQTQLRLYRYNTIPSTNYESVISFEVDLITNEKSSLVMEDGMLCERTDLMEAYFLNFMNGRDINVGSSYFQFNRELTRSCNSQLNIGNSKSFYGRSVILALLYSNIDNGYGCCSNGAYYD